MLGRYLLTMLISFLLSQHVLAEQSSLDLRHADWSEGQVHSIQGLWDFYWQAFISPEEFAKETHQGELFPVPGAWNSPPEGIKSYPGFGHATYRLRILVPPHETSLFLAIPDMASAYKLYNHGQLVAHNGVIASSKDLETPAYSPRYVQVLPINGSLDLVLQTSNFHYQWGGVWYPIQLTDAIGIDTLREKAIIRGMMSATVLLAASLFGLFIFLSRRQERVLLYFSLLCLAMGLRRLLIDERILYFYLGDHWALLQMLENLSTYLAFPFFVSYFSYRFPVKFSKQAMMFSWIVAIPFCSLALTTQVSFYTRFNVSYQLCILLFLPYIFFIYFKCLMEKRRGAGIFGLGLGIFILAVINDILTYSYVINTPNLSHIGILAFVIFQGIDLAKSYLYNFKKIEHMSASLQAKNKELMKIDAFKDEFLATTSHELRTPLHGISGLANHLLNDKSLALTFEHQHKLDLIYSTSKRLNSLVNDILDFSSIKHGNISLNKKTVDLKALANAVVGTLTPLVTGRDLRLSAEIETEARYVLADENRLQQILFNLLGNAIKFTEEGIIQLNAGLIEQSMQTSEQASHCVLIEIIDTGSGIDPSKYDLLFEPFQHFGEAGNSPHTGNGLGLSISKQLVQLHGGELTLESQVGMGTKVMFTLEQAKQPKTTQASSTLNDLNQTMTLSQLDAQQNSEHLTHTANWSRAIEHNTDKKDEPSLANLETFESLANRVVENARIFVVDDEEVNLELVYSQLDEVGYEVECFSSGNALLERIKKHPPDLVLLDLMMPTISGLDVCRELRKHYDSYELPVMMLTARYQVKDIVDCLSAGANDYLIKPYHEKELLARVYSQLSARKFWISHEENQLLKKEIDHRKQLENQLSIANSRLLHALDITQERILLLNEELEIIYANQPAKDTLSRDKTNLTDLELNQLLSTESETLISDKLKESSESFSVNLNDSNLGNIQCALHPFEENEEQFFALIIYAQEQSKPLAHQTALPQDLLKSLSDELSVSRRKFDQIEQTLKQISSMQHLALPLPENTETNSNEEHRRDILIKLLRESIAMWERYTLKTKADLAEESRCWRVYLDGTTAKTRTLDRYLSERTLPAKPRWQLVLRTAKYVLDHAPLNEEDRKSLKEWMDELNEAFQ